MILKKGPKGVEARRTSSPATGLDRDQVQADVREEGHLRVPLHDPPDRDEDDGHRQEVSDRAADRSTGGSFFADAGGAPALHPRGPGGADRQKADVERLAAGSRCRRRSRRRERRGGRRRGAPPTLASPSGAGPRVLDPRRAGEVEHRPHRPRRDDGQEGQGARRKFTAYGLPRLLAGLRRAARPGDDPGAADRGRGRRHGRRPLPEQAEVAGDDPPARRLLLASTWTAPTRASTPIPAASCRRTETFDYVWEARRGDRRASGSTTTTGPMDPLPIYKGLFGPLIIRDPGEPRPDEGVLHRLPLLPARRRPGSTGTFYCINGRAYAGNTPTLDARRSATTSPSTSMALDDDFHTFHIHGHRWTDPNGGRSSTTSRSAPATRSRREFVEDNPGRWFYHCHVFSHLHQGMNGWYLVELSASARPSPLRALRRRPAARPRSPTPPTGAIAISDYQLVRHRRSSSTSASTSPGTGSGPT